MSDFTGHGSSGRPSSWSDERMIGALAALRDELLVPLEPLALPIAALSHPRRRPPARRMVLVAAAAVVVLVTAGLAIAPAREAVADWLGIGSTEVRIDPEHGEPSPQMPRLADGARAVDARGARAELGRALPDLSRVFAGSAPEYAIPIEGGVLVRWPGHEETLWMRPGSADSAVLVKKYSRPDAEIEEVDDLGDAALWVGTSHVLQTPGRALAASHVLLWLDAGFEWRLEGDLARDDMIAIARSLD
jgi:hypothetical protein